MIRIVELFGGIGAFSRACKILNLDYELVNYIEFDKKVVDIFNVLHNTNYKPTNIKDYTFDENIDIVVAGFPCQDISQMGLQKGMIDGTRSNLIFTVIDKLKKCQNKPKIIILENVKAILADNYRNELNHFLNEFYKLGYECNHQILNAKYFGVPQNRERVFFILQRKDIYQNFFNFASLSNNYKNVKIKDFMDWDYDYDYHQMNDDGFIKVLQGEKYIYIKPYDYGKVKKPSFNLIGGIGGIGGIGIIKNGAIYKKNERGEYIESVFEFMRKSISINGIASCLTTKVPVNNVLLWNDDDCSYDGRWYSRLLYWWECFNLMGFNLSDSEKRALSVFKKSNLYYVAGNSIVVNILKELLRVLLK